VGTSRCSYIRRIRFGRINKETSKATVNTIDPSNMASDWPKVKVAFDALIVIDESKLIDSTGNLEPSVF
jgi:hypothetical protein